jgi:hypothetical protein
MTDDLIRRAAECECEFGKGCDVPSKPCRCALIEDMVNRILELEKFKSLHAQCDKTSLNIEQNLVDQVARYYGAANKYEKALLKIIEEDLQTTRHSDGSRGETIFDGYFGGIARAALGKEAD